jgi:hypothetical protein
MSIDAQITTEQMMQLPFRDAVQLIVAMVWFVKASENPEMTYEDAFAVPLGEALEIISNAENVETE